MMEGTTNIILALIGLLGTIITYVAVPYFKAKTTKEQRDGMYFWVKTAVAAAEMIYNEKGKGLLKKEYVVAFLVERGINININELEVLIEAAVKELNLTKETLN